MPESELSSPVARTELALARISDRDPEIRAFVCVDAGGALARAELLQGQGERGRPLFGLPVAVKDTIDVAGWPTEAGSRLFGGRVAEVDAEAVQRLERAGAIVVGKTVTHEMAFGTISPPTRNPADPSRIPGGSSGGAAAAVAAGMVPVAIGTDTTGSLRIPAALCGVCGLRPRPGAVPEAGVVPLAPSLDVVGPLARSAAELARVHAVLAGAEPGPLGWPAAPRLLVPRQQDLGRLGPEVEVAWTRLLARLSAAPLELLATPLPALRLPSSQRAAVVLSEALETYGDRGWYPGRAEELGGQIRFLLEYASRLAPEEVEDARRAAARSAAELRAALEDGVALLTPTTPVVAPRRDDPDVADAGHRDPVTPVLAALTVTVCFAGLAAVSIPVPGASPPVGLQVIATDEERVLGVAGELERVLS